MGQGEERTELWKALQGLTQDKGIHRDDLLRLLDGDLHPLRVCFGVGEGSGVLAVRKNIKDQLQAIIPKLPARPARRQLPVEDGLLQFRLAVMALFNVLEKPDLSQFDLTRRYVWLESSDAGRLKIKKKSAERDLKYAIDHIEGLILAGGYKPKPLLSDAGTPSPYASLPTVQMVPQPASESTSPASLQEPEPQRLKSESPEPSKSRRKLRLAILGAAVALVAGSVTSILLSGSHKASGSPHAVSSGSSSQVTASVAASDPDGFSPGTALQLTTVKLTDSGGGWSAVFPSTAEQTAARFTPQAYDALKDDGKFFAEELQAGAYVFGGVSVSVQVNDVSKQPFTIFNVRVTGKQAQAAPTGALRALPSQGNPTDQMAFLLDASTPVAKTFDIGASDLRSQANYFDATAIPMSPSDRTQTLVMVFSAESAAYSFDIAIDYTIGAKKYTQLVSNGGQPFRAAASLCNSQLAARHLSYSSALVRGLASSGSYTLTPTTTASFCNG